MSKITEFRSLIKSDDFKDRLLTGERIRKIYSIALLSSYIIIVIWIMIFKCNNNEVLNIQENLQKTLWERFTHRIEPFVDLRYMIRAGNFGSLEMLAFLFNIICFIPLSWFLSSLMNKKLIMISLFSFSLGIEIFQLFSGFGGFDPTDIFLNTMGALIGCLLIDPILKNLSEKTINATFLVFTPLLTIWAIVVVILTIIKFPI